MWTLGSQGSGDNTHTKKELGAKEPNYFPDIKLSKGLNGQEGLHPQKLAALLGHVDPKPLRHFLGIIPLQLAKA